MYRDSDFRELVPVKLETPTYLPELAPSHIPAQILADRAPRATISLLKKQLAYQERQARREMLLALSFNHTAAICTWLDNRPPEESGIQVDTFGESRGSSFFFAQRERVCMSNRVTIFHR